MLAKFFLVGLTLFSVSAWADSSVTPLLTECSTKTSSTQQWWRTLKGTQDGESYYITDLAWGDSRYGQEFPQTKEMTTYELDGFKYSKGQILWRDPTKVEVERDDGSTIYLTNFTYSICRTRI